MSLPTTALANVRVNESWIDRPFTDLGDTTTKVYYLRCHCLESDYTALVQGTANLTSATTAGVIATRYVDALARWVGDYDFRSSPGGYIQFVRRFANIPQNHNEYTYSVVTLPSGFWRSYGFRYLRFQGGDYNLSTRLASTYGTNPAGFTIVTPFLITDDDGLGSYQQTEEADGIGFQTIPDTNAFYRSNNERASETTKVTRWMGDIYVGVTPYVIPDNINDSSDPPV